MIRIAGSIPCRRQPHRVGFTEGHQPDSVPVVHGEHGEQRRRLRRGVDLPLSARAKMHLTPAMDDEHDRALTFLGYANEGLPHPPRCVPVDVADVVAGAVLVEPAKSRPCPLNVER